MIKPKSVDVIHESKSFGNAWYRGLRHIKMFGQPITFGDAKEPKYATDVCLIVNLTGNALQEAIDGKFHRQFPTREKMRDGYIHKNVKNDFFIKQFFFKKICALRPCRQNQQQPTTPYNIYPLHTPPNPSVWLLLTLFWLLF